jgi:hypothetical protein
MTKNFSFYALVEDVKLPIQILCLSESYYIYIGTMDFLFDSLFMSLPYMGQNENQNQNKNEDKGKTKSDILTSDIIDNGLLSNDYGKKLSKRLCK